MEMLLLLGLSLVTLGHKGLPTKSTQRIDSQLTNGFRKVRANALLSGRPIAAERRGTADKVGAWIGATKVHVGIYLLSGKNYQYSIADYVPYLDTLK